MVIITLIAILVMQSVCAYLMAQSAEQKGYGSECHIFSICFFLGIFGILYTISLPDKIMQKELKEIKKATSLALNKMDENNEEFTERLPRL